MDMYGKTSSRIYWEEDERGSQSPIQHHHHQQSVKGQSPEAELPRVSLSRLSSATVSSVSPLSPGPGSPWALSPMRRFSSPSPTPSLMYHCLVSLQRHDGNVYCVAVSGGTIYTGSDSDRVRVWKQPDCVDRGSIQTGHGRIRCILAHGSTLVTTHKDHRVRIWAVPPVPDRLRCKKVATLPPRISSLFPFRKHRYQRHIDTISCLALHHAEGLLYTGSLDRTVKAWRLTERACVDSFVAHDDQVSDIVVNELDGCLFTSSIDGSVKLWRRVFGDSSHALMMVLRFQPSPVNALALSHSRDTCFLYSGSSDGYVNIWEKEAVSGRYNHGGFLQGHRYAVLSLVAVNRVLLSGSEDTTIRVWRREKGSGFHRCLAVMEGHRGPVRCLAASVEVEGKGIGMGLLVYSASLDRVVKAWRIKVLAEDDDDEAVTAVANDECGGSGVGKEATAEYEMNPVLSPTWVELKLQKSYPF
ncbi:unnamed protein product [Musa acuminata subsp. malaccensis]|uniref:(wild Malaysian banana) hypothetical protein n=1 Tax=Musa acuminata subsp. malaccensis TaxID=214687 RepID=A0A804KTF0_MUSAM|nr:unnamed protein product [Musa acuminata subsp. malaccensis]